MFRDGTSNPGRLILKPFSRVKNWSNFFAFFFCMPSFVAFIFFAIILAVTFPYFLSTHTFLLSWDNMMCLLFFLFVCAFLHSTNCTRCHLFVFTQRRQSRSITNAIAQVHACYLGSLSPTINVSLLQFLFQFFFHLLSSWS